MLPPSTYLETVLAAGVGPYKHGRQLSGICSYSLVHISRRTQQLELVLINTRASLSGICSSVGLGAGLYGVGRQCYSLVRMSRRVSAF